MRNRLLASGAVALIAAIGLSVGASHSGERVEFDTVDDILATKFNAWASTTSAAVFDETKVHTYDLRVDPTDWEWLGDNPALEEFRPASLKYEGRTYEDVGIRYKGSYGALRFCFDAAGNQICDKLSLKLKFSEYDPAGRFFGLRRLNLHSMTRDPTKMHEALGYSLFREAGIAAPRTAYARVIVNGELLGLFVVVEEIDEDFIRRAFPDAGQGTLYKEVWPEQLSIDRYTAAVEAGPSDQAEAMLRFARAIQSAPDDQFLATLAAWVDIDTFMKYLAVDRLIDNWDGLMAWYCPPGVQCYNHNYYWYEEAFRDRVWLIPWDLDNALTYPSPIRTGYRMPDWDAPPGCTTIRVFANILGRPPSCDRFIARLAGLAWEPYAAATRELLSGPFTVSRIQARIDALDRLIAPAVAEDRHGTSVAAWKASVAALRANIVPMRAYIEGKLDR